MRFILNLPWTLCGCIAAILSIPKSVRLQDSAIVFQVRSLWWTGAYAYSRGARAATYGYVIMLGPNVKPLALEHELIHVAQYRNHPFIFPFLYTWELIQHGYKNSRFEVEAYAKAGNQYYRD